MAEPTITSKNVPGAPVNVPPPATPQAPKVEAEKPIVAKPLVSADFTNIKPKNKNVCFRWFNRLANGGLRVEQAKAWGFAFATEADADIPISMKRDGHIIFGDLVLMKAPREDYLGWLKDNEEKANARVSRVATHAAGVEQLRKGLQEVGGVPAAYKGKIGVFIPNIEDFERLK